MSPFRGGRERLIALVPLSLAALAVAAPFLTDSPWLSFGIRKFFSAVCHQDPSRSFWLAGAPVAVCVRCLGIYVGAAVGALIPAGREAVLRMFAVAVAMNVIDIAAEWMGWHGNLPALRFALGMMAGVAAGALVVSSLRESGSDLVSPAEAGSAL
jgi:uncharacterized membrane protein